MKKILLICTSLVIIMLFTPGCSKEKGCMDVGGSNYDSDAEEDDGSCTYTAGIGGDVTIVAHPKHHNLEIGDSLYPDSAFVKFNTSNFPGTDPASYDLVIAGDLGEHHVHIEGLKRGKYYIYMKGWDPTQQPGNNIVTGGIPYTVTVTSGEIDLDVPVTE